MMTMQRKDHRSFYRVHCDACLQQTLDGSSALTLREFWYDCLTAGWELPPPFPCETLYELTNLKALCPACLEKGLVK